MSLSDARISMLCCSGLFSCRLINCILDLYSVRSAICKLSQNNPIFSNIHCRLTPFPLPSLIVEGDVQGPRTGVSSPGTLATVLDDTRRNMETTVSIPCSTPLVRLICIGSIPPKLLISAIREVNVDKSALMHRKLRLSISLLWLSTHKQKPWLLMVTRGGVC